MEVDLTAAAAADSTAMELAAAATTNEEEGAGGAEAAEAALGSSPGDGESAADEVLLVSMHEEDEEDEAATGEKADGVDCDVAMERAEAAETEPMGDTVETRRADEAAAAAAAEVAAVQDERQPGAVVWLTRDEALSATWGRTAWQLADFRVQIVGRSDRQPEVVLAQGVDQRAPAAAPESTALGALGTHGDVTFDAVAVPPGRHDVHQVPLSHIARLGEMPSKPGRPPLATSSAPSDAVAAAASSATSHIRKSPATPRAPRQQQGQQPFDPKHCVACLGRHRPHTCGRQTASAGKPRAKKGKGEPPAKTTHTNDGTVELEAMELEEAEPEEAYEVEETMETEPVILHVTNT